MWEETLEKVSYVGPETYNLWTWKPFPSSLHAYGKVVGNTEMKLKMFRDPQVLKMGFKPEVLEHN